MKSVLLGRGNKGLTPKDAVSKTTSANGGQKVGLDVYFQFWANLTEQSATDLVAEISKKLVEWENQDKKKGLANSTMSNLETGNTGSTVTISQSRASGRRTLALQTLAQTFEFIHFFMDVDVGRNSYVVARKLWDSTVQGTSQRFSHRSLERCHEAMQRYQKDGSVLVNFAILDCSYELEEDFDDTSADFPFVLSYLRYYSHSNPKKPGKDLFECFEKNFSGILKATKKQPFKFISTLMNMLHILGELVVIWPPTLGLREVMNEILIKIRSEMLFWPLPYSSFALKAAQLIEFELKNPGFTLRSRVFRERPWLCGEGNTQDSSVLLVYESLNPHSKTIGDMLIVFRSLQDIEDDAYGKVGPRDVLLNILKLGLVFTDDVEAELEKAINALEESKVVHWLSKLALAERSFDVDPQLFHRLKHEVLHEIDVVVHQKASSNSDFSVPGGIDYAHWVDVPMCNFRLFDISDDSASSGSFLESEYPNFGIPLRESKRVMIIGGNETIHKVLCTYYHDILKSGARLGETEFFLVPAGRNDICASLATNDRWYRRHVYSPFSSHFKICPPVEMAVESGFKDENLPVGSINPLRMTYSLLSDFVQSSSLTQKIIVFECKCWKDEDCADPTLPFLTIPFVCRIELGLNSAVNRFLNDSGTDQRDRSASGGSVSSSSSSSFFFMGGSGKESRNTSEVIGNTWHEVISDKNFIRSNIGPGCTPEVRVSIMSTNLDGSPQPKSKELTPSEYLMFSVSNCPAFTETNPDSSRVGFQPYQHTSKPSYPSEDTLDISWITTSKSSMSSTLELLKKKEKKTRDLDILSDAIRTEQTSCVGKAVEIVATKRTPFLITADQYNYGPFFRIKIVPSSISMPVKHFVPK